ncbi:MAG: hypothetical protein V3W08_05945 [Candidatus Binatia bacterium]
MSQKSQWEYFKAIFSRYHKVPKPIRHLILNEFCQVCGYNRTYAIRLLNGPQQQPPKSHPHGRKKTYGHQVLSLLTAIGKLPVTHAQHAYKPSYPYGFLLDAHHLEIGKHRRAVEPDGPILAPNSHRKRDP